MNEPQLEMPIIFTGSARTAQGKGPCVHRNVTDQAPRVSLNTQIYNGIKIMLLKDSLISSSRLLLTTQLSLETN